MRRMGRTTMFCARMLLAAILISFIALIHYFDYAWIRRKDVCDTEVDVLIIVQSHYKDIERRIELRTSWAQKLNSEKFKASGVKAQLVFWIRQDDEDNAFINAAIAKEQGYYRDVLYGLKSSEHPLLVWDLIPNRCHPFPYLVITNDGVTNTEVKNTHFVHGNPVSKKVVKRDMVDVKIMLDILAYRPARKTVFCTRRCSNMQAAEVFITTDLLYKNWDILSNKLHAMDSSLTSNLREILGATLVFWHIPGED